VDDPPRHVRNVLHKGPKQQSQSNMNLELQNTGQVDSFDNPRVEVSYALTDAKWMEDIHVRPEAVKSMEGDVGKRHDLGLDNDFFG
ncbi:hypothetical protein STEG23_006424, partial [Scotinomys teguina]